MEQPAHFRGKSSVEHVIEARAKGVIASSEIHGTEIPGHISAGSDAAREMAVVLALVTILLQPLFLSNDTRFVMLGVLAFGWLVWKVGRSAWLGWSRLERLHRIVQEEKWEIEHHRQQEREELKALYAVKGFEGKLLDDVVDVLMADGERALRVMVEEELGLSLEVHEHPLKQAFGACVGSFIALASCLFSFYLFSSIGCWVMSVLILGVSGAVSAVYEHNRVIPGVIWNVGIGSFAFAVVYFLWQWGLQSIERGL